MTTKTVRICDRCGSTPPGDVIWHTLTNEQTAKIEDVCPRCVNKLETSTAKPLREVG